MNITPIKVLLIDSDPAEADLFRKILSGAKNREFDLEYANQLSKGLLRLVEGGIDLIILGLSLPDSQGLDTLARVLVEVPDIPIIVLISLDDETLATKAVQVGAQSCLVKGQVDNSLLVSAIYYALERKRVEMALANHHHQIEELVKERTAEGIELNEVLRVDIAERKRTEETLRESEKEYRMFVENLPQKIFFKDKDSVYILCNENYARDLNIVANEISGKTDFDFYPKDLAEKYRADDKRILKSGVTEELEELSIQGWKQTWIHTVKTPVKDEKGNAIGILGVFWDITNRKQAEKEKEKNLHGVAERVKELQCFYELSRVAQERDVTLEYKLQKVVELLAPAWQYPDVTCAKIVFDGNEFATINFKESNWKQLADIKAGGKKVGAVEICYLENKPKADEGPFSKKERDLIEAVARQLGHIIEDQETEEYLSVQKSKLEKVSQNVNCGLFLLDKECKIVYANKLAEKWFGGFNEIKGKPCYEVFKLKDPSKEWVGLEVLRTGVTIPSEISTKVLQGENKVFYTIASPVRDSSGEIIQVTELVVDITERKQIEEELRKTYDALDIRVEEQTTKLVQANEELEVTVAERKEMKEVLKRKSQTHNVLNTILNISMKDYSLDEMLDNVLEQIVYDPWFAPVSKGVILLVGDKPDELVLTAAKGVSKGLQSTCAHVSFGRCLCGIAALTKELVFANSIDMRHENQYKDMVPHGHYCVPIQTSGHILGVLTLYVPEGHQCAQDEEDFLAAVANVLAVIIERKQAQEEVATYQQHLEELVNKRTVELNDVNKILRQDVSKYKRMDKKLQKGLFESRKVARGMVDATILTIERRDPYAIGHQRRVSKLARAIAAEMGCSKEQIDALRIAGLIHDIGKIAIPAEIFTKPSTLTKLEFGMVKEHPQAGYDILKEIEFPWSIAQMVLQHHERMDGSGYPAGLPNKKILVEARILGVADVIEGMLSPRPYRPALGTKKALEEISLNSGILYDSKVVDACLKLFNEKRFKLD